MTDVFQLYINGVLEQNTSQYLPKWSLVGEEGGATIVYKGILTNLLDSGKIPKTTKHLYLNDYRT